MITENFLCHRRQREISDEERTALENIFSAPVTLPRRHTLVRTGEPVTRCTYLIAGFMCRYMDAIDGQRQLVSLEVPGDFVDLHGYPLQRLDHELATLGECTVAFAEHHRVTELIERFPHLGRILWFSTLTDAAMHREWVFRLGRLDALGRIAHLICETYVRLDALNLVEDGNFAWPLTQQDLGEACGLTSVHVNRTLRVLREAGLMDWSERTVRVIDFRRLATAAEFSPEYLYLDDHLSTP